jgi:hypothetical protein
MRPATLTIPLFVLLAACSSNDGGGGGSPKPAAAETPSPLAPSDAGAPLEKIGISIQGKGNVSSRDATIDCTSDGTTTSGTCSAYYETALYAEPAPGWSFSHWEPAVSGTAALLLTLASPPQVTAVFTQD